MSAVDLVSAYTMLDLNDACNATAASYDADRRAGAVNAWGNSLPAEEVPFGRIVQVSGIPFMLPDQRADGDHVEAVGQSLPLPGRAPVEAIALLCFGEMGEQQAALTVLGRNRAAARLVVTVPGWLAEPPGRLPGTEVAFRCSHLHYPGGYEIAALRPSVVSWLGRLPAPVEPVRLQLDTNPLFHLLAVTLIHLAAAHAG